MACALFAVAQLQAQTQNPPIAVSVTGKVSYQPAQGGKSFKVRSGAVLKDDGSLTLSKGSAVILLRDGKFARFDQGQKALAYGDAFNTQGLGFEYDFAQYVEAAMSLAAFARGEGYAWAASLTDPKKGGDGWGTAVSDPKKGSSGWGTALSDPKKGSSGYGNAVSDPKKGSSGWGTALSDPKKGSSAFGNAVSDPKKGSSAWGTRNSKITGILPFGNVLAEKTTFFWSNPGRASAFYVDIKDAAGNAVHGTPSRDTFCTIDLAALSLKPDEAYFWTVSPMGSTATMSTPLRFEVKTIEAQLVALNKVRSAAFFQQANDPALTRLAEAVSLERSDWYYAAWAAYRNVRRNAPSNLVRMMEAAFWARYELLPLAEQAAKK
jgi:hypothetical protein